MSDEEKQATELTSESGVESGTLQCFKALVRGADLAGVNLIGTNVSLSPNNLVGEKVPELSIRIWPIEYRAQLAIEQRVLFCRVHFHLTEESQAVAADHPATDAPSVVDLTADYAVLYRVPENLDCSQDGINLFASRNAVFNSWPFFRELVHSLVARMGIPQVFVPLFRLPPMSPRPGEVEIPDA